MALSDKNKKIKIPVLIGKKCPDCGNLIEHEGGCVICGSCGYSKCG